MFYDTFIKLCELKGVLPSDVLKEIKVRSSAQWKRTLPNGRTLVRLADYFDCSIDYLLGRTEIPDVNHTNTKNLSDTELNNVTKNIKPTVNKTIVDFLKNLS